MILIGSDFKSLVEYCKIKPAVIRSTDHQSVFLSIRTGVSERGKGYWKINNSILKEEKYKDLINNLIHKYTNGNNNIDSQLLWDVLKW